MNFSDKEIRSSLRSTICQNRKRSKLLQLLDTSNCARDVNEFWRSTLYKKWMEGLEYWDGEKGIDLKWLPDWLHRLFECRFKAWARGIDNKYIDVLHIILICQASQQSSRCFQIISREIANNQTARRIYLQWLQRGSVGCRRSNSRNDSGIRTKKKERDEVKADSCLSWQEHQQTIRLTRLK